MSDWRLPSDRLAARDRFVEELANPNNTILRERCMRYPAVARATFARVGGFQLEEKLAAPDPSAMPIEVEVRAFDGRSLEREKVIVLVLDRNSNEKTDDDKRIWQCTYFPYSPPFEGEEKANPTEKDVP
jgi:hypothetical protein